jgi:hypothetical protein
VLVEPTSEENNDFDVLREVSSMLLMVVLCVTEPEFWPDAGLAVTGQIVVETSTVTVVRIVE